MVSEATLDLVRPRAADHGLERLRIGFIPLVDCAPLVVARDLGFAAAEGLALDLVRETSWANIRDRIVLGHFDAAHMLAPMAVAARLGLGHLVAPVVAPWILNHGGNSLAVSASLRAAVDDWGGVEDPAAVGATLKRVVAARAARGEEPLTLASVHPFSCHEQQLRHWLAAAGLDPDADVRLVVVPPPYMVDAMTGGVVDGACVGSPWPSLAVEAGVGRILLATGAIVPATPEKVLGVRETFAERRPEALAALLRALDRAGAWIEDPANRAALAELLARPEIVGAPAEVLTRALSGDVRLAPGAPAIHVADFLRFHGTGPNGPINRPRRVDGLWFAAQMLRWGQTRDREAAFAAARAAYSPAVFDAVFAPPPPAAESVVAPFDGARFDAAAPEAWLDAHPPMRRDEGATV
ncbi:MAG: ABC transporter substrate-binding protein [Hyphomicrobiales bacterium]|nr:ABC transporter substrate-binding protein [Hyphomicrobiales bacterium]